jgi:hypothetical protein
VSTNVILFWVLLNKQHMRRDLEIMRERRTKDRNDLLLNGSRRTKINNNNNNNKHSNINQTPRQKYRAIYRTCNVKSQ